MERIEAHDQEDLRGVFWSLLSKAQRIRPSLSSVGHISYNLILSFRRISWEF